MSRRSGLPGRSTLACPRTSSRERGPHPHGERGDPGRGRLLAALGGGGRTEEVLRAVRHHCGRLSACRTPHPRARRRAPGWPVSADSSRATRARWVVAWAVIAIACFAVAVGGVTGESLFERLHSGAPTVESESSRAQDVIAESQPALETLTMQVTGADLTDAATVRPGRGRDA